MAETVLEKEVEREVSKYRVEDEFGIRFENTEELRRAISFLDGEKLPYELYGYRVMGVYKPVRDYLAVKGFKFNEFEIVDTRYLSEKELRQVRLEQAEFRGKAEKRLDRILKKLNR